MDFTKAPKLHPLNHVCARLNRTWYCMPGERPSTYIMAGALIDQTAFVSRAVGLDS